MSVGGPRQIGEPICRVAAIAGGELHVDDVAFLQHARRGTRIAEDLRGVCHRGGADDEKIDVAAAFQDRGAGCGPQLILRHAGSRALNHRIHGVLAQLPGLADAVEFFIAVHREQLVHPAFGEDELGIGQILAQHVELVDRQIVLVPWIDLEQADTPALQFQFADAVHHHVGIAPAAAAAHVRERRGRDAPHCLGMRAAHRIDQGRIAFERDDDVAAQRVPLPMPGEPQHAAAEAPVARAAGRDDGDP